LVTFRQKKKKIKGKWDQFIDMVVFEIISRNVRKLLL